MPSKDRKSVYKLQDNVFQKEFLNEDLMCNPFEGIFSKNIMEKFSIGNHDEVLFVTEEERIIGVVHIVDYNSEFLYVGMYY